MGKHVMICWSMCTVGKHVMICWSMCTVGKHVTVYVMVLHVSADELDMMTTCVYGPLVHQTPNDNTCSRHDYYRRAPHFKSDISEI